MMNCYTKGLTGVTATPLIDIFGLIKALVMVLWARIRIWKKTAVAQECVGWLLKLMN